MMDLPPARLDEKDLIKRARRGDDDAFGQLVEYFTPGLYRVVRRMASDSSEAQAIVQETFLRVWSGIERVQDDRPFFPYLLTVALNLSRDQWRRARWLDFGELEPLAENLPQPDASLEEQVEQAELLEQLARSVQSLPSAYRAVIALRYDGGLDYQQIAVALGLPVNTVRTHLRRAKAYLWKMLATAE